VAVTYLPAHARFKDLCIDVNDVARMGPFWAAVLGLELVPAAHGARLVGTTAEQTVWLNTVPEARSVKQRVHLDVYTGSIADLEVLGARRLSQPAEFAWTVMADPEGGEFCAFERARVPARRLYEVSVDCADATATAGWWAEVFGGSAGCGDDGDDYWYVEGVDGLPFESLVFASVPEPKLVKNRLHWDVTAWSVEELEQAGARVLGQPGESSWTVMADPEGNEFCVFAP